MTGPTGGNGPRFGRGSSAGQKESKVRYNARHQVRESIAGGGASSRCTVQSAARAVRILRLLFLSPEGMHLTQLSDELGPHVTTMRRLLRTLVLEGVVRKRADDAHYHVDPFVWAALLARTPAASSAELAQQMLRELVKKTGGTVMVLLPVVGGRSMAATMWAIPERVVRVDPSV